MGHVRAFSLRLDSRCLGPWSRGAGLHLTELTTPLVFGGLLVKGRSPLLWWPLVSTRCFSFFALACWGSLGIFTAISFERGSGVVLDGTGILHLTTHSGDVSGRLNVRLRGGIYTVPEGKYILVLQVDSRGFFGGSFTFQGTGRRLPIGGYVPCGSHTLLVGSV